ncbi:uncharacterized protein Nmlp_2940A [Natronomonas moolapensis 8.8.11]|uniref:Uncharacterized protein n=1 Tax=Natronomonas moolapensis (strain DSM 18674 / CECT 7526 / JCM 14361 / 8.8.11) TaxID=268739 RepID=M1Y3J4_NATM8|nr:hypothetical protein [Natronomonas moolapensis]CCQ37088.1 uncharacterized protein Nmlp_2940A [Natronomonas moolapensis 8.8.11]
MIRRTSLVIVIVCVAGLALSGLVVPGATTGTSENSDNSREAVVTSSDVVNKNTPTFGINISASPELKTQERRFKTASNQTSNASESLSETTSTIEEADSYGGVEHNRAKQNITEIEQGLNNLSTAEDGIKKVLKEGRGQKDVTPAEQFLLLSVIEEERRETESTAENSLNQYENAVSVQRRGTQSTVITYFAGALLAGLFGGAALGSVVPLIEARNVRNKMKLSRNVSYNRRAGIVPVIVGAIVLVSGFAVIWHIGVLDLIGVIL